MRRPILLIVRIFTTIYTFWCGPTVLYRNHGNPALKLMNAIPGNGPFCDIQT